MNLELTFRDPIHGYIRANNLESAVIVSRPIQRLRFIRQLGFACFVFPGAEHSRFTHALGSMEIAGRLFDRISAKLSPGWAHLSGNRDRNITRIATLLRDSFHLPFSHSTLLNPPNDLRIVEYILGLPEIRDLLATEDIFSSDILSALCGNNANPLVSEIVSGPFSAHSLDQLLRDSHFTGVNYGRYDLDRLIEVMVPMLSVEQSSLNLGIEEDGVHAVEGFMTASYYMLKQVYWHDSVIAYHLHLDRWLTGTSGGWANDPERLLGVDDYSLLDELRASQDVHARAITTRASYGLVYRGNPEAREKIENLLAGNFPSDQFLISPLILGSPLAQNKPVFAITQQGQPVNITQLSLVLKELDLTSPLRVYAPSHLRKPIEELLLAR